ncbi:MAG: hypothetical protein GY820_41285 [Gammaproteobacteria bacterium]|nr:hypothetical protein [Gammaproteobacteria bacterium]
MGVTRWQRLVAAARAAATRLMSIAWPAAAAGDPAPAAPPFAERAERERERDAHESREQEEEMDFDFPCC